MTNDTEFHYDESEQFDVGDRVKLNRSIRTYVPAWRRKNLVFRTIPKGTEGVVTRVGHSKAEELAYTVNFVGNIKVRGLKVWNLEAV